MQLALIYYYWSERGGSVEEDFKNPIILSIATFRKFNQDTPIYVLDVSKKETTWGRWNGKLGFEVRKREAALDKIQSNCTTPEGITLYSRLLSKVTDIHEFATNIKESIVMFSDADVMWVKNPFPLEADFMDKFCSNQNTGVFYFNRQSQVAHKVLQMWSAFCTQALVSNRFCNMIAKAMNTTYMHDEIVMNFIQRSNPQLFSSVPVYENFPFALLGKPHFNIKRAKNLHIHCNNFGRYYPKKAMACLCVKELYDIVAEVIGEEDLKRLLGEHDIVPTSMYDYERMAWLNERDQ